MMLDVEGPWTPEKLDGVSQRATERQELLSKDWPAGTVCPERTAARRLAEDARACAAWMRLHGLDSVERIGPFGTHQVPKGRELRIKRGSLVFSSRSSHPRAGKASVRAQVVKVHRTSKGFVDWEGREGRPVNPEVYWEAAGGYWCWTDLNNSEPVEVGHTA